MEYNLSVRKEAETDITEAFEYYQSCRENLGHDFLLCLEETLAKFNEAPSYIKKFIEMLEGALLNVILMVFTLSC